MRIPLLLSSIAVVASGACAIPRPAAHGPVAAPAPQIANEESLLAAVRMDYPQATLERAAASGDFRVSFGPGQGVKDVDAFVDAFLKRHAVALAAGPIRQVFVPPGKEGSERVAFGSPLSDSGCRRIRLGFVLSTSGPVSLQRACERFRKAPPSYASRPLPSTATGTTDPLVRVGAIGGFAGPLFSGFVIDRFGDVYDAHDYPGPFNVEPPAFVGDYVKTLPPAEVEQFAFDVSLVAGEKEQAEPESAPAAADQGSSVVQAFVGAEGKPINLPYISASAARRATQWARDSVRPAPR